GWSGQEPAPGTRQRVAQVRELARRAGADVLVGVDGGGTIAHPAPIRSRGVDVIVSGSAIFGRVDPAGNLDLLTRELVTLEVPDGKRERRGGDGAAGRTSR